MTWNLACLVTWNKLPAFLKATKDERLHKHYRIVSVYLQYVHCMVYVFDLYIYSYTCVCVCVFMECVLSIVVAVSSPQAKCILQNILGRFYYNHAFPSIPVMPINS